MCSSNVQHVTWLQDHTSGFDIVREQLNGIAKKNIRLIEEAGSRQAALDQALQQQKDAAAELALLRNRFEQSTANKDETAKVSLYSGSVDCDLYFEDVTSNVGRGRCL